MLSPPADHKTAETVLASPSLQRSLPWEAVARESDGRLVPALVHLVQRQAGQIADLTTRLEALEAAAA